MRWGLIPPWAKDSAGAASMINAGAETAATKPAFRDALKSRKYLIPADGFYEWQKTGKAKQPYCFEIKEGELFAVDKMQNYRTAGRTSGRTFAVWR